MSRRARRQAQARPWEMQRDADDAADVDALLGESDEHLRDRAWEQWEIEKPQGDAR